MRSKTWPAGPPSCPASRSISRRPSASSAGRTAARRLSAAAALVAAACSGSLFTPVTSPPARIDFIDGAIEPLLERSRIALIEGFGFDSLPGTVRFARVGGGQVTAVLPDSAAWTDGAIRAIVPDSATTGSLTVSTQNGHRVSVLVHVFPHVVFAPSAVSWVERTAFPQAPVGVALAAAEVPAGAAVAVSLYAAGGAEPTAAGADTVMVPDSGVYVARAQPGDAIGTWTRQHDDADPAKTRVLPVPRAFAAAAVATRYNSHFNGSALYVIGGIDASGAAQATVFAASVTGDSVNATFVTLTPLPAAVAGAIAVVHRGRIYVIGGTDSTGHPQQSVYVGRIDAGGGIDGWYTEPALGTARAYGGGVVQGARAFAFGGVTDSVPPGGGFTAAPLATSDTAPVSAITGFLTGSWSAGPGLLPQGRSAFATLDLGDSVLVVGGNYAGASSNSAETLAAAAAGDSLGPFAAAATMNTIAGLGGGTLIGPAGVAWRDADGTHHALVLGGINLVTRLRTARVWGF